MRHSSRTSLNRVHVLWALGLYCVWTVVTYLLEGRILTLLRPEAALARLTYAVVANVLIGVIVAVLLVRHLIRSGGLRPRHYGLRAPSYTLFSICLATVLGFTALVFQQPPSLNPVVLLNGFAQVWVVSAAEILVCWALLGKTVELSRSASGSRWSGMATAWIISAVAFGVYHFAHSPPFNTLQMVGLLTVVGLVTGAFYFAVGEVYGAIVFHNFLALTGVTRALADAGRLGQFESLQMPLILMALLTTVVLVGLDFLIVRRPLESFGRDRV